MSRLLGALLLAALASPATAADLRQLSIEQLANIEISSVSKTSQPLSDAPAAIYVITAEDIRRSGATALPEILRLAPNLEVAEITASNYAISARGFNNSTANKLLVLIDGRSVYTPLYSGVFWDMQNVMPEDIERIEVISGPGATLWGANAVNGVINIITKKSADTQGGLVEAGAGNLERRAGARYGGTLGDNATWRVYAMGFDRSNTITALGTTARDAWSSPQGGFRLDWEEQADSVTFQGDLYESSLQQLLSTDITASGHNLLARWNHRFEGSALQVQAYYDKIRRYVPQVFGESLDTYDVDIQHSLRLGDSHDLIWGGGYRISFDRVRNSRLLSFLPADETLVLANLFAQDTVSITPRVKVILGAKVERNNYTGDEPLPSARLSWKITDTVLLWAAISRAVRTPSRIDRDFFVAAPGISLLGGQGFRSEKLIAYELGTRMQALERLSFSLSGYYNDYEDLRSIDPLPGPGRYKIGNRMEGHGYGLEFWGNYSLTDWWRWSAGAVLQRKYLTAPAQSLSPQAEGNDPGHQLALRSSMNLTPDLTFDLALRQVGSLPSPRVPAYVTVDGQIGWAVTPAFSVSLSGFNLLHARTAQFGPLPGRSKVGRSFFLDTKWGF